MKAREAISRADDLRPNAIAEKVKGAWLQVLDEQVKDFMGIKEPVSNNWPDDWELAAPDPYAEFYAMFICSRIDNAQMDSEAFNNDNAMYETSIREFMAWWRRNNRPASNKNWRV